MLIHVLNVTSCDCNSSAIQAALLRSENSVADCASSSYSRTSLASQMYFVRARIIIARAENRGGEKLNTSGVFGQVLCVEACHMISSLSPE